MLEAADVAVLRHRLAALKLHNTAMLEQVSACDQAIGAREQALVELMQQYAQLGQAIDAEKQSLAHACTAAQAEFAKLNTGVGQLRAIAETFAVTVKHLRFNHE